MAIAFDLAKEDINDNTIGLIPALLLKHENKKFYFPVTLNGNVIDMSSGKGLYKLPINYEPFTGRGVLMYNILKTLNSGQSVNVFGDYGLGKTRLLHWVAYNLN